MLNKLVLRVQVYVVVRTIGTMAFLIVRLQPILHQDVAFAYVVGAIVGIRRNVKRQRYFLTFHLLNKP